MTFEPTPSFDPKSFLAKVGDGGTVAKYGKEQIVFSQGDPADAVFYIQKGKVKVTVVSEQGKEAVVALLATVRAPVHPDQPFRLIASSRSD